MTSKDNALSRSTTSIVSPLRYPGSKRRLAGYIKRALEINKLKPTLYIEPFAGGASVALQLMQDDMVERAILMDRDPLIAGFWRTVFFDADWLIRKVETIDVTLEKWKAFKKAKPRTDRNLAITCLFLNRTSFSGILAPQVGPIGGKDQNSPYPIDCRFPRQTLVKRIRQAAELRDRVIDVWDYSWDDGLARIRDMQDSGALPSHNVFFYFDPPFFKKADKLYRFYFEQEDHQALRDYLLNMLDHWILSYDSATMVEKLYGPASSNGTHQRQIELLYSTSVTPGSQPAREVVLSNLKSLPSETRLWRRSAEWRNGRDANG